MQAKLIRPHIRGRCGNSTPCPRIACQPGEHVRSKAEKRVNVHFGIVKIVLIHKARAFQRPGNGGPDSVSAPQRLNAHRRKRAQGQLSCARKQQRILGRVAPHEKRAPTSLHTRGDTAV
jgi:hypothetical protein